MTSYTRKTQAVSLALAILFTIAVAFGGCASRPPLTPEQRCGLATAHWKAARGLMAETSRRCMTTPSPQCPAALAAARSHVDLAANARAGACWR